MANLPDINKQSLGGTLGTATHGTGKTLRAIHGDVTALKIATVDGKFLECSKLKNPDLFDAALQEAFTLIFTGPFVRYCKKMAKQLANT